MRVVQVEDYFDTEAGYQVNELVKVWPKEHELIIISTKLMDVFHKTYDENQRKKDLEFEKKYNVKLIRLDIHFKISGRIFYKELKSTIKKYNPDILFLHGIGDFKDLLFLYGKNKYITYRDCHMSWVASKNKHAKLYYKIFNMFFATLINKTNKYTKIYALGGEEIDYIKVLGIKENKIELLPHGYNSKVYYSDKLIRKKTREYLKIQNNDILISYIGKFDLYKEPHLNLEIFNKLDKKFVEENNLKFLFLGPKDISYMQEVFNKKLENFKFRERVIIENGKNAEELIKFYNASDICLWPKETTLSSIHAQVCGVKIIMEKHESNKERVIQNKYLYEINNLNDAKKKLITLVENLNIENLDLASLQCREYHKTIEKLINSWSKKLGEQK